MGGPSNAGQALLGSVELEAAELWRRHPPKFSSRNKKRVLALATATGTPSGPLIISRYRAVEFPSALPPLRPGVDVRDGVFTYDTPEAGTVEWHLNFADPDLFFGCGGPAFAQDEIQVAEHPVLAAVRASLRDEPRDGLAPLTVERDSPTPFLIEGAQRQCSIALVGIYGRAFDRAKEEAIRCAVTAVVPPTRTNILAISALTGGSGAYTRSQIKLTLETAWSGFAAARHRSSERDSKARTILHTGHWGTGAFGGDRVLMASIQLFAARLAAIDRVVFHAVDSIGVAQVREAEALLSTRGFEAAESVDDFLDELSSKGFRWGVSDGN